MMQPAVQKKPQGTIAETKEDLDSGAEGEDKQSQAETSGAEQGGSPNAKETQAKIRALEESLEKVKADLSREQMVVATAIKMKTKETKEADYSVVDEIPGIGELFENYYRIFDVKQKLEEEYFELKRTLSKEPSGKGMRAE